MWASAYWRGSAAYLRYLLLVLRSPRPLYERLGRRALASGHPQQIAQTVTTLEQELAHCHANAQKLHATYPSLYPKPTA